MIGKNSKTFQTISSTKIFVENIACLEPFLMSFSKYPISNVWKWINGKKKFLKNLLTLDSRLED